jgi:group I intron endonuclease
MRIYSVTNNINGKQYVGQTVTMRSRHGHGHMMRDAYKKYGFSNFTYETIYSNVKSDDLLDYAERFWIKVMGSMAPNGYNLEEGGKRGKCVYHAPQLGKPHTEEVKRKMSEGQKRYLASLPIHHNVGKTHSEETKAKMSAARKGRIQSAEEREMRSKAIKLWHQKRKEQSCQQA